MAINVRSVLVTGASRGIGLEFVRQLIGLPTPPEHVMATCLDLDNCPDLQALSDENKNVHILKLDIQQNESFASFADQVSVLVGEEGLTMVINKAGAFDAVSELESLTKENLMKLFDINSVGPVLLAQALLPLLRKAAAANGGLTLTCNRASLFNITTLMGSIGDNASGGRYAYRASKCALNMFTYTMHLELSKEGILVGLLHPGGEIPEEESVSGMLKVIANMDEETAGLMVNYTGKVLPW